MQYGVRGKDDAGGDNTDLVMQYLAAHGIQPTPQIISQLTNAVASGSGTDGMSIGGANLPPITAAPNPAAVETSPLNGVTANSDGYSQPSQVATGPSGQTRTYEVGGGASIPPSPFSIAFNRASADAGNGQGQGPAGLKSDDASSPTGGVDPSKVANGQNSAPSKPAMSWDDQINAPPDPSTGDFSSGSDGQGGSTGGLLGMITALLGGAYAMKRPATTTRGFEKLGAAATPALEAPRLALPAPVSEATASRSGIPTGTNSREAIELPDKSNPMGNATSENVADKEAIAKKRAKLKLAQEH